MGRSQDEDNVNLSGDGSEDFISWHSSKSNQLCIQALELDGSSIHIVQNRIATSPASVLFVLAAVINV